MQPLLRSLLFVPALDRRKLETALDCGADAIILDLEGSIAPAAKADARREAGEILAAMAARPYRPKLFVRLNDLESGYCTEDLAVVIPECPDGVLVPKARNGADVARLAKQIDALERYAGLNAGRIGIIVMVTETPHALLQMDSFLNASPRLRGLAWGKSALRTALGASASRDSHGAITGPYALARNLCLITAHAAGVQAVDSIYGDFRNLAGLAREARDAARDGFTAKFAVHPAQVAVINQAFTPTDDEVEAAHAVINAFEGQGNPGVVALNGRMLYHADLENARSIVGRANMPRNRLRPG